MSEAGRPRRIGDIALFLRLWAYLRVYWRVLLLGITTVPVLLGLQLAEPYVLKIAIDDYIKIGRLDGLGGVLLSFCVIVVVRALVGFGQRYAFASLGERGMRDLRIALFQSVLKRPSSFLDRVPSGDLLTRVVSDIQAVSDSIASMIMLVVDVVELVGIAAYMVYLDPKLALACFVVFPLLITGSWLVHRISRAGFRAARAHLSRLSSHLLEHLDGIRVVQLFTREAAAQAQFDDVGRQHRGAVLGVVTARSLLMAGVSTVSTFAIATLLFYGSRRVGIAGGVTLGLVFAFTRYLQQMFQPITTIADSYADIQAGLAGAERVFEMLDLEEEDAPVIQAEPAAAPGEGDEVVRFDDVCFEYRPNEPVLRNLSLVARRGETVAVVGPSGSGKSTIVRLLTRLYEPASGSIYLDGRDVRTLSAAEVRSRVCVVSQDVFLFAGSVADNVRIARPDATDAEVARALERVGADLALARKNATADDQVVERGANFSSGERQLVAFARALIRDPQVLVLDEATAHIDPESERIIERGLAEIVAGRTSIVIAHRLATVRRADRILVVSEGRVVESGTHAELIALGGLFASLENTLIH